MCYLYIVQIMQVCSVGIWHLPDSDVIDIYCMVECHYRHTCLIVSIHSFGRVIYGIIWLSHFIIIETYCRKKVHSCWVMGSVWVLCLQWAYARLISSTYCELHLYNSKRISSNGHNILHLNLWRVGLSL